MLKFNVPYLKGSRAWRGMAWLGMARQGFIKKNKIINKKNG